mgnify:FL=1|tara:strand:- start:22 stop:585 length:564 start_codon:yes stop_codon:yes gene_type:complete
MATLTPTLTLVSTDALSDSLNLSVTDSLSVLGQTKRFTKVLALTATDILLAADYTKSYVFMQNKSSTTAEIITIGKKSTDATCDYNNATGITMDSTANISFGMTVTGTGIPAGSTVASVTNTTTIVISETTTGGAKSNETLTFGMEEFIILGPGEFCFLPWDSTQDLEAISASGTPTLEVMIFQAAA